MELLKPKALKKGDTIGVFTPAFPSYDQKKQTFLDALSALEDLGFKVKLGFLTEKRASEGYRPASGKERAKEFMDLICDPEIKMLMATTGGTNSNSLIPYLDFDLIRKERKIICGYSDVTALHLAILHYSKLKTLYGPSFMTFGEKPEFKDETFDFLFERILEPSKAERILKPFSKFMIKNSNNKNSTSQWQTNPGWKVLNPGEVIGDIVVANFETLMSSAGTPYFPELKGKILYIESLNAPWSVEERRLRQLELMGVYEKITGLVMGKAANPSSEGASFSHGDLILEVVGKRNYPIVTEFDCSHVLPMYTLQEHSRVSLKAKQGFEVEFKLLDSYVEE